MKPVAAAWERSFIHPASASVPLSSTFRSASATIDGAQLPTDLHDVKFVSRKSQNPPTNLCKAYSNGCSMYRLVYVLTISRFRLNDMPGSQGGSIKTRHMKVNTHNAAISLTCRTRANEDGDIRTHCVYSNFERLPNDAKKFVFAGLGVIVVHAAQDDRSRIPMM